MNILVCDHFTSESLALLAQFNIAKSKNHQPNENELFEAEALLVRSRTKLPGTILNRAPKLQYIVTATSGFDHIDWPFCRERNIKVAYSPEANVTAAAEHTFAMLLSHLKKTATAHTSVKKGYWREGLPRLEELQGLELGLLGFGRIGQRVAKIAKAFEMVVSAYDPYVDSNVFKRDEVEAAGLLEILMGADVVSLHLPLTTETRHIINYQTLPHMNSEAYLINVARGALVDELELALAIEKGQLKGAALDVFEKEPLPKDSRLLEISEVFLSPHLGGYTEAAFQRASLEAVRELLSLIESGASKNCLPVSSAWFDKTWK